MYRGQATGLKAMGHSKSCRCHIVAATGAGAGAVLGSAKSRNGVGHPSDGAGAGGLSLLDRPGRLAAWPSDSGLPLTNGELPFLSTALCSS